MCLYLSLRYLCVLSFVIDSCCIEMKTHMMAAFSPYSSSGPYLTVCQSAAIVARASGTKVVNSPGILVTLGGYVGGVKVDTLEELRWL